MRIAMASVSFALWTELTQLTAATALVRSDWAGRLTAAGPAAPARAACRGSHSPRAGEDIAATQPTALASAPNQLLAREVQQR